MLDFLKLYKHVGNEGIWLFLNVFLATIWSLKKGEVFQVENWRSNFLLPGSSCLGCAASVTKLNLLKERGNSSPYFKSPKPSKESLHFHFPFFLFTMTIQTTFFNEFHLVTKQPTKKSIWNLNFHAKNILNSFRMFDSFFLSLKGISWQKTVCQGDLPWHIPWLWNYGHRHLSFSFVTWLLFATPAAILKSFKFGQRLEFIHFRLILLTCQARRSLHSKRGEKMRIRIQTCVAQWAKINLYTLSYIKKKFLVSKLFLHFFIQEQKNCV